MPNQEVIITEHENEKVIVTENTVYGPFMPVIHVVPEAPETLIEDHFYIIENNN